MFTVFLPILTSLIDSTLILALWGFLLVGVQLKISNCLKLIQSKAQTIACLVVLNFAHFLDPVFFCQFVCVKLLFTKNIVFRECITFSHFIPLLVFNSICTRNLPNPRQIRIQRENATKLSDICSQFDQLHSCLHELEAIIYWKEESRC